MCVFRKKVATVGFAYSVPLAVCLYSGFLPTSSMRELLSLKDSFLNYELSLNYGIFISDFECNESNGEISERYKIIINK